MCKKNFNFMYFLSYYEPCTIDSAKNRTLFLPLPKGRGEKWELFSLKGKSKTKKQVHVCLIVNGY